MTDRLASLVASFDSMEIDAMLITDEINVSYLSGFTGDSSYLLVDQDETTILSDGRYETQLKDECPSLTAVVRPPGQAMIDLVRTVVNDSDKIRIGIEADQMTLGQFRSLCEKCPGAEWIETQGVVSSLRMIKDEDEILTTRLAVRIAERSFQSLLPTLNSNWTERAIAHQLEATMRFLGAEGVSFPPIVAAGPAGALPHYRPGRQTIGDASTILVDWGACFSGYASDLTRTLHRSHASSEFRRAYDAVLESQLAAIDAIGPGVEAKEVDAVARGVLEQAGLGDAFKHGLGHGLGLQIHESPRMSSMSTETLQSGMIITVEPGVYFEGEFGIRIEDDILVTDTGHEVLSTLPKGLDDCGLML